MGHADESARKWEAAAQSCWGPGRLPAGEASVAILGYTERLQLVIRGSGACHECLADEGYWDSL